MAFEATKREWCELYTFFRLLTEGKVTLGTAKAKKGEIDWPIAMIQREEHDGTRCYYIEKEMVRIKGENSEKFVPREDFGIVADLILQAVKSSSEDEVILRMEWKSFWMKSQFSIWKRRRKIVPIFILPSGIRRHR